MTKRRVYDSEKHIHFVTFSCYKRRKHLQHKRAMQIVIGEMGSRLSKQDGMCLGFVIMPDHVHAMIWFSEIGQLSSFMNKWKEQSSKTIKALLPGLFPKCWAKIERTDPIWQARYYGFNIWSRKKVEEKLNYMHQNPVRAGLVDRAEDWKWSSANWYSHRKSVRKPIRLPPGLETDDEFNTDH